MAALTTQTFPHAGGDITFTASGGGLATTANTCPTGQGVFLIVRNTSGSSINVDIRLASTATIDGIAGNAPGSFPARRKAVANNAVSIIPVPQYPYMDPTTGLATFDVSSVAAGVDCACCVVA